MKNIKYIPWILLILVLGFLSFYFWRDSLNIVKLLDIRNEQLQQSNLEIGRAETRILKERNIHKAALIKITKDWQKEIKKRKAIITMYGELEAQLKSERSKVKTLTKIVYKDRVTEKLIELPKGKLFVRKPNGNYEEVRSLSYDYKDFRINIKGDVLKQILSYKLHQKFKGQLIETRLPTGARNHYIKIFELNDKDKIVEEIKLTNYKVIKSEELSKRIIWWNPKLDLGVVGGINQNLKSILLGEIGLSISSYGKTYNDISWRFLRLGIGMSNRGFSLSLSPVQMNLGEFLPLISNLWLMPYAGINPINLKSHFGLGISVVF